MSTSDVIAIAGLIVAIVGIPITFIVARRTRLRPQIRYATDFDILLRPGDNLFDRGLYMTLGDHKIVSISRTRLAFWNHRGDTVHNSDILNSDPLRLQLRQGDEVLQARVITMSRKPINLQSGITSDTTAVSITFEFLDTWDGGVIEVIHKGPEKPSLVGTLQGCDMYDAGSANLTALALKAVAEKSRLGRFRKYVMERTPKKILILSVLPIFIVVITAIITFVIANSKPNRLVNAAKYKLNTMKGQIGFAHAVANTRAFSSNSNEVFLIVAAVFIVIFFLVICWGFFRSTRRVIPGEIVTYADVAPEANKIQEM